MFSSASMQIPISIGDYFVRELADLWIPCPRTSCLSLHGLGWIFRLCCNVPNGWTTEQRDFPHLIVPSICSTCAPTVTFTSISILTVDQAIVANSCAFFEWTHPHLLGVRQKRRIHHADRITLTHRQDLLTRVGSELVASVCGVMIKSPIDQQSTSVDVTTTLSMVSEDLDSSGGIGQGFTVRILTY